MGHYPELKALKNDHYCNSFLTSPAIDVYLGHDKGQLRQTILKHEYIFRHQVCIVSTLVLPK